MRITFSGQYRHSSSDIETASERLAEYQRQVSSGLRVERPSDDPPATSSIIVERSKIGQIDQYTRSGDSAYSRLTVLDTVMSDIVSKLTAAQTTAVGVSGTLATPEQRAGAAQQIDGIKTALLDDFNTTFQGNYVFAGTKSTTKPYVAGAGGVVGAYAGSATDVSVDIGQGRAVAVGFNGQAITKGTASADLFATLDGLVTAINAGDSTAIGNGITALNDAFQRATLAQSRVGSSLETLESEKLRLGTVKVASETRLSKLEDANMADAITGMQQADTAYKAALAAAATASKTSLMDYL